MLMVEGRQPTITKQRSISCSCGRTPIVAKGLCGSCYTMKRQDAEYYGGLREKVLQRDGHACRVCGKAGRGKKSIMVHHRVPGKSVLSLMISLCLGCHSRVHKLAVIDEADAPELLRILWREQHPQGIEQYALDYSTALITHQTGSLFA